MTSFFDEANRAVFQLPKDLDDERFLQEVAAIEEPVIHVVQLNTGDREFPDDLRERILGVIATEAIKLPALGPTETARRYVLGTRSSLLLNSLHACFHALASRRSPARWGRWSDSPTQNLASRRSHDEEDR